MSSLLMEPYTLPCGVELKNRFGKAPMSERLADEWDWATEPLCKLYRRWAEGGTGMLVTGNVMVDRRYLESPGNVIIEDESGLEALKRWAAAGTENNTHLWMQIGHPGRQSPKAVSPIPVAPSPVQLGLMGMYGQPRPLRTEEIPAIIQRYIYVAGVAKKAGFTGVQLHGAHGYLISEFLSPITNRRTDQWGGSLENRARFLLTVVRGVRAVVGDGFPVCVKLNSADFQQGGFSEQDSRQVIKWLEQEGVDLLELSGGTYEQMALFDEDGSETADGQPLAEASSKREAYFLEFAKKIREESAIPLMVSGGFRTLQGMEEAVRSGATDLIGLGRPLCVETDIANKIAAGTFSRCLSEDLNLELGSGVLGSRSSNRTVRKLNTFAGAGWYGLQLARMGRDEEPGLSVSPWKALYQFMADGRRLQKRRINK